MITIGIPVYNEEVFLAETIQSALNLDNDDIKVIVSDNHSSDGSLRIAREISENDHRLTVIQPETHITATDNFQFVLSAADTKYFLWLGGHDLLTPDYIDKAIEYLENDHSAVMAYPKGIFIDKQGNELGPSDSEIDTRNLDLRHRIEYIAENLMNCTALHGVFRLEIAQKLPFEKIFAPDLLMLFAAVHYGNIVELDMLGYYRREVRKESVQEIRERQAKYYGITSQDPYHKTVLKHLQYFWNHSGFSFFEKLWIWIKLQRIFKSKFGTSIIDLGKLYFKSN